MDLGASRIALGRLSFNQGRLRLDELAVESTAGHPGSETAWLERSQAALKLLRARADFAGPVVLVLPPHLTLTKLIKIPRVEPAQRGKILRFEAEQSIPYAPTDVVWDTVVAAEHADELELLLVAAKREAVEALCAAVRAAGFVLRLVLPSSLATLAAFRLVHGKSMAPAIVLNLGARSTTLLQVTDRRFAARTLALGTRNIIWRTAEQQDHVALEVIATRLAQEIMRSVMHFRRQGGPDNPVRIHLTGGGARLPGLGEALAARVKVPVEALDLSGSIEIGRGPVPPDVGGPVPGFADLVGAAAIRLRPGQPLLNLLPPARPGQTKRRRRWIAAGSLAATAACWMLFAQSRPAAESGPVAAVIPHEPAAAPPPAEASPPPSVTGEETEAPFDLKSPEVKTAPFPLQLAGYLGEAGDYQAIFTGIGQPGTVLARRGHRFESLGLTLREFAVRKVAVNHADAWPVYEVAAFAVLHDEKSGAEVVLDSRHQPPGSQQVEGAVRAETRVLQPVRPAGDTAGQPMEPLAASVPPGR